jgi:myo-inositol 2-dehydrogenase / D-chiro-inositol 1-dehydrogenase
MNPVPSPLSRRQFLTRSSSTLAAASFPFVVRGLSGADANNQDTLKLGLVGCGGRGTGAAEQALSADYNTKLHAVADVFSEKAEASIKLLGDKMVGRVDVPAERQFIGMDGYKKLLECCDVVILATPPGFRPMMLEAAVEAGKHIFCEKPMAVDATGYRKAMEAVRKSKEKKLCLVAGFCWRRSPSRKEAIGKVLAGEIGAVTSISSCYHTGPVKPMQEAAARLPEWSDLEWQIRNWYNFSWLGGDGLVEQAVHSVDKLAWAMGDKDPISCVATGGRQIPSAGGNIYDHFSVVYEYPDNVMCHIGSRQIKGCYNEVTDYIRGEKGVLVIGKGDKPFIDGPLRWRFRGEEKNMYQVEHDEFFAAIRKGEVVNDGDWMLHSTMVALMGRMASYTGKKVAWADAINSSEDLAPEETFNWHSSFQPTPMPQPGQIKI